MEYTVRKMRRSNAKTISQSEPLCGASFDRAFINQKTHKYGSKLNNMLANANEAENKGDVVGAYYLDKEKAAEVLGKGEPKGLARSDSPNGFYHTLADPKAEVNRLCLN